MSFDEKDLLAALKKFLPDAEMPSGLPVSQFMSSSRWEKKLKNPPPAEPTQTSETKSEGSTSKSSDNSGNG